MTRTADTTTGSPPPHVADGMESPPPSPAETVSYSQTVSASPSEANRPKENRPNLRERLSRPELRTVALIVLCVLAAGYTLHFAKPVLFPILLSLILTSLLRPFVRSLTEWHIPPVIGSGFVVGLMVAAVLVGVFTLVDPAREWVATAPENMRRVEQKFRSLRQPFAGLNEASKQVEDLTNGEDEEGAIPVKLRQRRLTGLLLSGTRDFLAGAFITVILVFFMLALGEKFLDRAVALLPTWREKQNMRELLCCMERGISSYLLTVTTINACLGLVIGTAMWVLGMPNPGLWGFMAAVLNFIPYLGALVGAGVVFAVAVLTFDSVAYAALAPLIYMTINSFEGNIVTPMVLGRSMSLNPLLVFLSLIVWGWLWGVGGALLAVPILAVTKVVCDHFRTLKPVGRLLSS